MPMTPRRRLFALSQSLTVSRPWLLPTVVRPFACLHLIHLAHPRLAARLSVIHPLRTRDVTSRNRYCSRCHWMGNGIDGRGRRTSSPPRSHPSSSAVRYLISFTGQ